MDKALRVAIVGAESTGKTTLAAALAARLALDPNTRVAWVPEVLREWCAHTGRTPLAHEQASILRAQHERVTAAAASHDIVVCDTTALMTAVYSRFVFGDRSLDERAVALHRAVGVTLLTALDLPWVADGHQRDGPQVREPVDQALRELMDAHGIAYAVVSGTGEARVDNAMAAVAPLLRGRGSRGDEGSEVTGDEGTEAGNHERSATRIERTAVQRGRSSGLFTRLGPSDTSAGHGRWACDCCVPAYERALRRRP